MCALVGDQRDSPTNGRLIKQDFIALVTVIVNEILDGTQTRAPPLIDFKISPSAEKMESLSLSLLRIDYDASIVRCRGARRETIQIRHVTSLFLQCLSERKTFPTHRARTRARN